MSEVQGKVPKEESVGHGSGRAKGSTQKRQLHCCLRLSYLVVTSIWIVKLDRKTRKVQAA